MNASEIKSFGTEHEDYSESKSFKKTTTSTNKSLVINWILGGTMMAVLATCLILAWGKR
jgi:hypothetical protein